MDEIKEIKNRYYKVTHDGPILMSGLPLPKPGKYKFINCSFHPAVDDLVHDKNGPYADSVFIDC